MPDEKIYLRKQHTRRGVAGYKTAHKDNPDRYVVIDQETGKADPSAVRGGKKRKG